MSPAPSCARCRFMFLDANAKGGHCKRYPPTVVAVPMGQRWAEDTGQHAVLEQHFPWMGLDEWCGEFVRLGSTTVPERPFS